MSPAPHAFAPHAFDWLISDEPVPYEDALARMNEHVEAIRIGTAGNLVWLLEHPPLYTAGTSAKAADLVDARFPSFNIKGERREGRVGIWIAEADGTENKIGALGVRVRHGVTFHGVSLNVDPDLTHFGGIVPCGISEHGVTSLAAQGILVSMPEVDAALRKAFLDVFGAKDRD